MSILARTLLQKFPTSLLRTIFENFGANEPVCLPLQRSDSRYILIPVCRRWARIVRSTSSFWDHILFTKPHSTSGPNPLLYQFYLCTTRSGRNPLSITFAMVCGGWSFSIVRCIIIPHLQRIEILQCPIYGNSDIVEFLTIDAAQFHILKSVNIWFINTRTRPLSSFPLDVSIKFCGLRNAPRLRNVVIHLANGLCPTDLYLPWRQLTTLDFGKIAMSPEEFIMILHLTALRLESGFLYIRFSPLHTDLPLWKHVITLHALRTLRLKLLFPSADMRLFSLLRFPILKYTWIQMHDHYQDWETSLYTELLRASTDTLQLLHLTDYLPRSNAVDTFAIRRRHHETTYDSLEKLFEVISNVQDLHLPLGLYAHSVTLDKMALCTLLPQLRTLELGTVNAWPILYMARRRREHLLSVSFGLQGIFRSTASQSVEDFQLLGSLTYIYLMIPLYGFSTEDHVALIAEARALGLLGIRCRIQTTDVLPLPVINSGAGDQVCPPNAANLLPEFDDGSVSYEPMDILF